ncbi:hypothetical protein [Kitasatospora aureofaciens]|uniref:hypothetical protein n=1 Tax=Kitasatospora aureofaciens TaxID=1894 RepID=UPI00381BCD21
MITHQFSDAATALMALTLVFVFATSVVIYALRGTRPRDRAEILRALAEVFRSLRGRE